MSFFSKFPVTTNRVYHLKKYKMPQSPFVTKDVAGQTVLAVFTASQIGIQMSEHCAGLAEVKIQQTFRVGASGEAHYTVPVRFPVHSFIASVGGRKLTGRVLQKDDARQVYTRAVARGRTAALACEEVDGAMTISLGAVPRDATVLVQLSCLAKVLQLVPDSSEVSLTVSRAVRSLTVPTDVIVSVPFCPTVGMMLLGFSERRVGSIYKVSVPAGTNLGQDLILHVDGLPIRTGLQIVLERSVCNMVSGIEDEGPAGAGSAASGSSAASAGSAAPADALLTALVTVRVPEDLPESMEKPVFLTLLLDVSSSMSLGHRHEQQLAVALAAVDNLKPRDRVNAIAFGRTLQWFEDGEYVMGSVMERKEALRQWIRGLCRVAENGTRLVDAVGSAVGKANEHRASVAKLSSTCVFLVCTDFDTPMVHSVVKRSKQQWLLLDDTFADPCLLVFGVGFDAARDVGQGLATHCGGVYVEDVGRGPAHLATICGKALQSCRFPAVQTSNVQFSPTLLGAVARAPVPAAMNRNISAWALQPLPCQRLRPGQLVQVPFFLPVDSMLFAKSLSGSLVFRFPTGLAGPRPVVRSIDFFFADVKTVDGQIVKVVAQTLALEHALRWHAETTDTEKMHWKNVAVELSCAASIACPLTAFVAVDSKVSDQKVVLDNAMHDDATAEVARLSKCAVRISHQLERGDKVEERRATLIADSDTDDDSVPRHRGAMQLRAKGSFAEDPRRARRLTLFLGFSDTRYWEFSVFFYDEIRSLTWLKDQFLKFLRTKVRACVSWPAFPHPVSLNE
jgi:hypothetical protein